MNKKIIAILLLVFLVMLLFGCITPDKKIVCGDNECHSIEQSSNSIYYCPEDCETESNNCAKEGEQYSKVFTDEYPTNCCTGLTEWKSGFDTREVVDGECVETDLLKGSPIGTCINCGNGVCESIEDICNCPQDCETETNPEPRPNPTPTPNPQPNPTPTPKPSNCAKEGEQYSKVFTDEYPTNCCTGLTEWASGMDTRQVINGECITTNAVSGNPVGQCINCGNGICETIENICNCPKDCVSNVEPTDFVLTDGFKIQKISNLKERSNEYKLRFEPYLESNQLTYIFFEENELFGIIVYPNHLENTPRILREFEESKESFLCWDIEPNTWVENSKGFVCNLKTQIEGGHSLAVFENKGKKVIIIFQANNKTIQKPELIIESFVKQAISVNNESINDFDGQEEFITINGFNIFKIDDVREGSNNYSINYNPTYVQGVLTPTFDSDDTEFLITVHTQSSTEIKNALHDVKNNPEASCEEIELKNLGKDVKGTICSMIFWYNDYVTMIIENKNDLLLVTFLAKQELNLNSEELTKNFVEQAVRITK